MHFLLKEPRERKFKNFERFKELVGVKSDEWFLSDPVFKDYVAFHRKHRYKNNFYLKEILFELLSYPNYFVFYKGFVDSITSKLDISEKTFYKWFTEFLEAGIVRRVSKTVFKRMSRFDFPE